MIPDRVALRPAIPAARLMRVATLGLLVLSTWAGVARAEEGAPASRAAPSNGCEGGRRDDFPCAWLGLPLSEALQDLQGRGLRIIYSSDLVRPDMIVERSPGAGPLRKALDGILAPFGLAVIEGPGGTLIVV